MKATIKEVAKLANVSKSTVSRVLNKSGPVSKKTRKAVLSAVTAVNYQPNLIARSLTLKRTNTVCLMAQDTRNPYNAHACWYAERYFRSCGYITIIINTDNDIEVERSLLKEMVHRNVDGVLCIGGAEDITNIVDFKTKEDLPVVLIDREVRGYNIPTITIDNVYGGRIVVDYLFSLGHKKIAFVTSDFYKSERDRLQGYLEAHRNRGVAVEDSCIISQSEEQWHRGECNKLLRIFSRNDIPTAIFASNDYKALRVLRLLRKNNFSVPDDISVVGYDDIEVASIVHPALTTVHQPLDEMVTVGAAMLLRQMNSELDEPEQRVMYPWLVERESTTRVLQWV